MGEGEIVRRNYLLFPTMEQRASAEQPVLVPLSEETAAELEIGASSENFS